MTTEPVVDLTTAGGAVGVDLRARHPRAGWGEARRLLGPAHGDGPLAEALAQHLAGTTRTAATNATCRGLAAPEVLTLLTAALHLRAADRLLDVGRGLRGPAAWARTEVGAGVVSVHSEPTTVAATRALFGDLDVLVASPGRLPLATATCAAAWVLDALQTVPDAFAALQELSRVVAPGGRVAIVALVAVGGQRADAREAAELRSSESEVLDACQVSGLVVEERLDVDVPRATSGAGLVLDDQLASVMAQRAAGGDRALAESLRRERSLARLVVSQVLRPRCYVAEVRGRHRRHN